MADQKDEKKENKNDTKEGTSTSEGGKVGIVTWGIMLAVVVLLSASGYVVGYLMPVPSMPEAGAAAQEEAVKESLPSGPTSLPVNQDTWYYNDLESVVVNPDEPGATRYIRVGLILEISNQFKPEATKGIIDTKKPLLINWLNLYFKSQTLSAMENERGLNRILIQICDGFNEILAPESKPLVKKILIREFNIQ